VNLSSDVSTNKSDQDQINEFAEEVISFDFMNFLQENFQMFCDNVLIPQDFSSNIMYSIIVTNEEKIYIKMYLNEKSTDLNLNSDELESYMKGIIEKNEDEILRDIFRNE